MIVRLAPLNNAIHVSEAVMPLPVIAGIYRVSVNQLIGDEPIANVLHFSATGSPTAAAVGAAFALGWGKTGGISALQSTQLLYKTWHVTPLDGSSIGADGDFSLANKQAGANVSAPVPVNSCLVLTLNTGLRGRSQRGRIYFAGIASSQVDSPAAHWAPGTLTAAVTEWGVMVSHWASGTPALAPVVASYRLATANLVSGVVARRDFGTQRKRTRVGN
jgi:hypothetical protein